MIRFETYQKIQAHKALGIGQRRTADDLKISLYQVTHWWHKTEDEFHAFEQEHEFMLDNYRSWLLEQIKPFPQIDNTLLFQRLRETFPEVEIPKSSFFRYVKKVREQAGLKKPKREYIFRAAPEPGKEAQVDFAQYVLSTMYGNHVRVYFFCMVLAYSGMRFVYFSAEPFTAKKAIEAHRYAFRYFGGRPQMIVYDQDRCLVVNENFGEAIFVKEFEEFVKEMGYSVYLCCGHNPETKGRVESFVGVVKRKFLIDKIYCGIDELNMQALAWLDGEGNEIVNQRTKESPRRRFQDEYLSLQKVYASKRSTAQVITPNNGTVQYEGNYYQIPVHAVMEKERVRVERQEDMLLFYHAMTNDLLCKHQYTEGKGKTIELPPMEQRLSIEYELSEYYRDDLTATEFLKQLKLQSPRFCYQQCRRLKKLRQYYTAEELDVAFSHCLCVGICTMLELASYLMYRYGEERIKRCVPETVYISYQKRVRELREESHG